jgi:hypothetical protein
LAGAILVVASKEREFVDDFGRRRERDQTREKKGEEEGKMMIDHGIL